MQHPPLVIRGCRILVNVRKPENVLARLIISVVLGVILINESTVAVRRAFL